MPPSVGRKPEGSHDHDLHGSPGDGGRGSDGRPRVLEFNTLPGLTHQSAYAQACAAAGISSERMIATLIDYCFLPRPMEVAKKRPREEAALTVPC